MQFACCHSAFNQIAQKVCSNNANHQNCNRNNDIAKVWKYFAIQEQADLGQAQNISCCNEHCNQNKPFDQPFAKSGNAQVASGAAGKMLKAQSICYAVDFDCHQKFLHNFGQKNCDHPANKQNNNRCQDIWQKSYNPIKQTL